MRPCILALLVMGCTSHDADKPADTDVGDTTPTSSDSDASPLPDTDADSDAAVDSDLGGQISAPGITGTWPPQATTVGYAQLVRFNSVNEQVSFSMSAGFRGFDDPVTLEAAILAHAGCRVVNPPNTGTFDGATRAVPAGELVFAVDGTPFDSVLRDHCDGPIPCTVEIRASRTSGTSQGPNHVSTFHACSPFPIKPQASNQPTTASLGRPQPRGVLPRHRADLV